MVLVIILMLFFFLFIGVPIGFTLTLVGSAGLFMTGGYDTLYGYLSTVAYRSVNNFTYSAIPLFILMAHFISKSEIADDLFNAVLRWVGHKPGGAGLATVTGSAGFGALSGSSLAAVSVMSEIAVPKMKEAGYSGSFSAGLVATTTGTLAALIPPSILLVLYGVQTDTSVGKLLIAGIIPGILLAILVSLLVIITGIIQKSVTRKYTWKERLEILPRTVPVILLIVFIVSIIYFGIATPTESAAFGAFGAMFLGLVYRRLTFNKIMDALFITIKQTGMIFMILLGSTLFSYYITLTRVTNDMMTFVESSNMSKWVILLLVILVYLILGMFVDGIACMLLTLPLTYPLITGLGFDGIWFGVIVVLLIEIGLVTPPVGINLFVVSEHSKESISSVLKGSIPFILILFLTIAILTVFPSIVTYLPSIMS